MTPVTCRRCAVGCPVVPIYRKVRPSCLGAKFLNMLCRPLSVVLRLLGMTKVLILLRKQNDLPVPVILMVVSLVGRNCFRSPLRCPPPIVDY